MDKKTDYALRAVTYLAMRYQTGDTVNTAEISEAAGAPRKFLAQILLALKNHALLISTPGRDGGYRLMRRPDLISVAEIINAVSENKKKRNHVPEKINTTDFYRRASEITNSMAEDAVREVMSDISLARLLERVGAGEAGTE